jgi:Zn-finger nucleic acid-binding protein
MTCPNCGEALRERERSGIEIDVCPACRGVWLDRGELDKLVDRESRHYADSEDDGPDFDDEDERSSRRQGAGPRKKRGFFQNIMDAFGEGGMDD